MGAGGGERNGKEGIVFGSGGNVTLGILGMLGNGGITPGLGKDGCVGRGKFGIEGSGSGDGSDGLGRLGRGGNVGNCIRWRAAKPVSKFENDKAITNNANVVKNLEEEKAIMGKLLAKLNWNASSLRFCKIWVWWILKNGY